MKLQSKAIKIVKRILNATLKVIVSGLPAVLKGKSNFTKQKPGTHVSMIKPENHLNIAKGKFVGDIKTIESIDSAITTITPMYQRAE